MKCETCNKEMVYFTEGQTCGWTCNSCGGTIVTTYYDEISMDETIYSISILPGNSTVAKNVKCVAKIIGCSFIDAKELLLQGTEINELTAVQARDVLKQLKPSDVQFEITPEFNHSIE